MKRQLIIDLETSALTPEIGDIIRFHAESVCDPDDKFDEWVKPPRPLSLEAEQVIDTTNDRLAQCRPMQIALPDFLDFIDGAKLVGDQLDFDLLFLKAAVSSPTDFGHQKILRQATAKFRRNLK